MYIVSTVKFAVLLLEHVVYPELCIPFLSHPAPACPGDLASWQMPWPSGSACLQTPCYPARRSWHATAFLAQQLHYMLQMNCLITSKAHAPESHQQLQLVVSLACSSTPGWEMHQMDDFDAHHPRADCAISCSAVQLLC